MVPSTPAGAGLTIAICTRNRAGDLDRCLASLASTLDGRSDVEVLVVDNGSTDATPAVVAAHRSGIPGLGCVEEPVPGLSRARNTALRHATGDVVAFLDDDVTVDGSWLGATAQAFTRPAVDAMAGRIVLAFDGRRPRWLHPSLETWFAALDLGEVGRDLADNEHPFGANMAIRRTAAQAVGGFDEQLGYRDGRLIANEETELFGRLRREGAVLVYEPAASVRHHIGGARLRLRWVLRRSYAQGRTNALLDARGAGGAELRVAAVRVGGRALLRGWGELVRRVWTGDPRVAELARGLAARARQLGYARECLARAAGRDRAGPATPTPPGGG